MPFCRGCTGAIHCPDELTTLTMHWATEMVFEMQCIVVFFVFEIDGPSKYVFVDYEIER